MDALFGFIEPEPMRNQGIGADFPVRNASA
jgi:hypothetical protein